MPRKNSAAVSTTSHSEMPSTPTFHESPTCETQLTLSTNWSWPSWRSNSPSMIATSTSVPPEVASAKMRDMALPSGEAGTISRAAAPRIGSSTIADIQGTTAPPG